MKKLYLLIFTFFSCAVITIAQPSAKYFESIDKAANSYQNKEYKKSALFYATAFKSNGGKAYLEDRLNAARSWALAGGKDSAFVQLFKVVQLYDFINFPQIANEPDFSKLQSDKRWKEVLDIIKQNISKLDFNLNSALVVLLDSVYRNHHSLRLKEVSVKNEFGAASKEMNDLKNVIKQNDSINLSIVVGIIDKYGWLGKNVVGFIGNYTLALIIQQADIQTQKKYLPIVREAFKNKNVEAYDMALLEDKVALREGRKQVYGSVVVNIGNNNYVAPIENIDMLAKLRHDFGLKPMNEYLKSWSMKWDVNKYKKDLLFLETQQIKY